MMHMKQRTHMGSLSHQRGAVLAIALIMLLVMTILGVTAMQMSRVEERMAGNTRDINLAFQGAEAGLRDAEARLDAFIGAKPPTCATAPCNFWRKNFWTISLRDQALSWWNTNGREYGVAGTPEVAGVTRDPRTVTQEIGCVRDSLVEPNYQGRAFHRVTANSAGASNTTEAVLESTYAKRVDDCLVE
jgi:type IV pilus assembly protein PilX